MTNFTDIRDFLRAHCARYPELALQDVFKALYQSAFGCEHLIADPSAAADYIRAEAARSGDRISELVELLSGDYCRVHLGILQDGLNAETFARLFALSARHEECGREKLEAMLTALQTMADAGELPFSAQETAEAVERWRKDGFPPLHHSEIFRQNYAPAYRILRRDFARALPLFARIDRLTAERSRVLVAIEGGSASGKTTLGELLQNVYGCPVFHMDDFFLRPEQRTEARFTQPGGNVDRERFLEEVLIPLREGRPVDYRRFDCKIRNSRHVFLSDYAHHPKEILQSARSLREIYHDRKITAIFQPHLYTRTRDFYRDFAEALSILDEVILTEIYPAREQPIEGVTSRLIYDNLAPGVERSIIEKKDVLSLVRSRDFDVLVVLGAGDLDNQCDEIASIINSKEA